jgi:hypothetical protein
MTNNQELQLLWSRELGWYTIGEFPHKPNSLPCWIQYQDEENTLSFHFGSWGMNPENITSQDCYIVCQSLLEQNCNISVSSFKANLDYVLAGLEYEVFQKLMTNN